MNGEPKSHKIWMFASKKIPSNAVIVQIWIVLNLLVNHHSQYNQALCHHSFVLLLFGDKHKALMRLSSPCKGVILFAYVSVLLKMKNFNN